MRVRGDGVKVRERRMDWQRGNGVREIGGWNEREREGRREETVTYIKLECSRLDQEDKILRRNTVR